MDVKEIKRLELLESTMKEMMSCSIVGNHNEVIPVHANCQVLACKNGHVVCLRCFTAADIAQLRRDDEPPCGQCRERRYMRSLGFERISTYFNDFTVK